MPAPTYLEKNDISLSDHHLYCRLSQQAVDPIGESRHEIWAMQELAKHMGRKEHWLFEDPWKALEKILSESYQGGDLTDIRDGSLYRNTCSSALVSIEGETVNIPFS